ncbi:calcium uptake protein 3, mitochondrial-like isoform X2 [Littorina saxatilis]|uniref:calcium uptake protein 3, mitochondrial-like isoform X2 n=1 Tax=Littorina saxatilis TaxID=31220 RepID=UPI0038B5F0E9
MATRFTRLLRFVQNNVGVRFVVRQNGSGKRHMYSLMAAATTGCGIYAYNLWMRGKQLQILPVVHARNQEEAGVSTKKVTYREARFRQFASVEYDGVIYMSPQDFLESITEESPRPRIGRVKLTRQELEQYLRETPKLSKGSDHLFRKLHGKGIISYTEYLFLLCVLTKPHSGFRIAFNMFDTDGNQKVDKGEFLVLENFFILPKHERKFVPRDQGKLQQMLDLERVFSKQGQGKGEQPPTAAEEKAFKEFSPYYRYRDLEQEIPDTTLLVHFFGPKGTNVLNYSDFHKFMADLQNEVIELEFLEFSRGMSTISEVDFAKILLRYTNLDRTQIEECIERVTSRIPEEKGISLEDFRQFCQFLNSLDDFSLTMKMYTYADRSISHEDFQRAVKVCTGHTLSDDLVKTVFQIFDSDGDGNLSHQEFISIMKDRLHRGARSHLMHTQNTWDAFRSCVRTEMRSL